MDKYQYMSDSCFLESLLENMAEGIVILDKDLNVLCANKGFSHMFGWSEEEVMGRKANRLPMIPSYYGKKVQNTAWEMLFDQSLSGIETKGQRKDGTLLDVLVSYNPVVNGTGEVSGMTMVFRDITSRKITERLLQESEKRYKSLFEKNPDAVFSLDLKGHFTSFNSNVVNLLQYTTDELQSIPLKSIVAPEYWEETWRCFLDSLNGKAVQYEIVIMNKRGQRIDVRVKNVPIKVDGEIVNIYGVAKDISKEKNALIEVHRVKEELELIWDHMADAAFVVSDEGLIVKINQSFTQIFGWTEDEIVGLPIPPMIPDHYKKDHQNLFKRFRKGEKVSDYEHQRLTKEGALIDVLASYTPVVTNEGKVIATVGIYRDISGQKRLENMIKENEQRYKSLFLNHPDAIVTYDLEGNFTSGNKSLKNVLGYSIDELMDKSFGSFIVPDDYVRAISHFNNAIEKKEAQSYEIVAKHKKGSYVNLFVMSIPIIIDGKVTGVYGVAKDITEKEKIEKELRDSEERYRMLIELSPDALLVQREGKIVFANSSAHTLLSSGRSLLGREMLDFIHPEYHDLVIPRIKKVESQRESVEVLEEKCITIDGNVVDVEVSAVPIIYEGTPSTLVIVRDITGRRKKEKEIEDVRRRLQLYWNHVSDAVFSIGYDGAVIDVNPAFTKMLGFTAEELRGLPVSPLFTEEVIHYQPQLLESFRRGEEIADFQTVRKTKNGELRTVLAAYKAVNEEDILAIGIYKDITNQLKVQKALAESEERYRSLFEYNRDAVWSLDLEGNFTSANPAFEKMLGISPDIVTELNIRDFEEALITPFQDIVKNFEEVKKGRSIEYGLSMYRADGEVVHLKFTNVPIFVNGKITGIYGIGKDVTDEVDSQKALVESEYRYRLITENMNDLIVMFDLDGIITYASPSYQYVLGIKPENYISKHVVSLIHEEDRGRILFELNRARENQHPFITEFRKRNNLNEWFYFEAVCMPVFDEEKSLQGFVGVSRNITDRKEAEQALQMSQERYRLIADNSQDLILVANANQELIYASPSYRKLLGYTPEEVMIRGLFNVEDFHPEDINKIKEFFKVALSTGEPQISEYRSRHRNGDWVWLESVGTPVLDEQGKFSQFVMVSRDISERKGYEAKLQHLAYHDPLTDLPNRRLFGELVEQALKDAKRTNRKAGIMYMDLDGFKEVNDTLGHDIGDDLLVQFTKRVRENLREMDVLARMGGDEFTILLPKTEKLYVNVIAKRILQAIQEPYLINGRNVKASSSIGIALYPEHGNKAEELIKNADFAMYQAKVNGKNNFQFVD